MQHPGRRFVTIACAALAGVSITALTASQPAAQYKMTVNKERLINAANEPQNWLMMNGDYSSQRYSKLTQINAWRDARALSDVTPFHIWLQLTHRFVAVVIAAGVIASLFLARRTGPDAGLLSRLTDAWPRA